MGWLIDLGNISIGLTINMIHAFAAVNRLIAITLPGHYQRMMTAGRTTAFCVSCLLSWIILRLPCLYPVTFMAYEFKNTTTSRTYPGSSKRYDSSWLCDQRRSRHRPLHGAHPPDRSVDHSHYLHLLYSHRSESNVDLGEKWDIRRA